MQTTDSRAACPDSRENLSSAALNGTSPFRCSSKPVSSTIEILYNLDAGVVGEVVANIVVDKFLMSRLLTFGSPCADLLRLDPDVHDPITKLMEDHPSQPALSTQIAHPGPLRVHRLGIHHP
ncbi:hypothetical protein PM082_001825 [Marasmius tenuissimus]|nr:hypothetical protein PM082_001825 [Marasmius tenuissimus]